MGIYIKGMKMPKYIDLDEIRKLLDACPNKGYVEMDEIPPADVVEVVRCKDCKYSDDWCGSLRCNIVAKNFVSKNWFCASGERKVKSNGENTDAAGV